MLMLGVQFHTWVCFLLNEILVFCSFYVTITFSCLFFDLALWFFVLNCFKFLKRGSHWKHSQKKQAESVFFTTFPQTLKARKLKLNQTLIHGQKAWKVPALGEFTKKTTIDATCALLNWKQKCCKFSFNGSWRRLCVKYKLTNALIDGRSERFYRNPLSIIKCSNFSVELAFDLKHRTMFGDFFRSQCKSNSTDISVIPFERTDNFNFFIFSRRLIFRFLLLHELSYFRQLF